MVIDIPPNPVLVQQPKGCGWGLASSLHLTPSPPRPGVLAEGLWSFWGTSGIGKAGSFNYFPQFKKAAKTVLERHSGYKGIMSGNEKVQPGAGAAAGRLLSRTTTCLRAKLRGCFFQEAFCDLSD